MKTKFAFATLAALAAMLGWADNLVENGSFEDTTGIPNVGWWNQNNDSTNVVWSEWTYAPYAGWSKLGHNDFAWLKNQTMPDEGDSFAFLQRIQWNESARDASISQMVRIPESGVYTLTFYCAGRKDYTGGILKVSLGGDAIAQFAVDYDEFVLKSFKIEIPSAGDRLLKFETVQIEGDYNSDKAIAVDAISLVPSDGDFTINPYSSGLTSFAARGGTVSIETTPLSNLLSSATVWYDPSDDSTLTKGEAVDGKTPITAIANKGSGGSTMNAELFTYWDNDKSAFVTLGIAPYLASINGNAALAFTNNIGFASSGTHTFTTGSGRAVFAVGARQNELNINDNSTSALYPVQWIRGSWAYDVPGILGVAQSGDTSKWYIGTTDNGNVTDLEVNAFSLNGEVYIRGANAGNGEASGVVCGNTQDNNQSVYATNTVSASNLNLTEENARVFYGWSRRGGNDTSAGLVGEALAFDRVLTEREVGMVQSYLQNKWQTGTFAVDYGLYEFGTIALENGTVDFNGASAKITNLSGYGTLSNVADVTITENIVATAGKTITVQGDLDLSSATITPDDSFSAYNDAMTITSTGTLSGKPTLQLSDGDMRKFKIMKSGNTVTITRIPPGLVIVFR